MNERSSMLSLLHVQSLIAGRSVAVVGNAQSLLGKGQGDAIDEHDIVVRLNLGVPGSSCLEMTNEKLVGLVTPRHVGARMDVWGGVICPGHPTIQHGEVANLHAVRSIDLGAEWNKQVHQCWIVPFRRWWPVEELIPKTFDGNSVTKEARQAINLNMNKHCSPTTGFVICYLLLGKCAPVYVTLFGFDGFQSPSYPSSENGSGHDGGREMLWLKDKVEIR